MSTLVSVLPHVFIPLTLIIAMTSVIGFFGNAMAFYVFHFRFPSGGFNKLMATLAVYGIAACLIHMPLDIATFFQVGSARSYLCKITCFQLAFTSTGSALVLLSIAVVRFYGIHKPFLGLFSTKSANYVIVFSVLMAAGIGLPITFLFGAGELEMESNVTAAICAVESRFMDTMGPIGYYFVLAGLYVIALFFHTFLYVKSVVTVWSRRKVFMSVSGNKNAIVMTPKISRSHNVQTPIPASRNINSSTNSNPNHKPESRSYHGNARHPPGIPYSTNAIGHCSTTGNSSSHHHSEAKNRSKPGSSSSDSQGNERNQQTRGKNNKKGNQSQDETSYSNASTLPVRGGGSASAVNNTSYRVLAVVIAISVSFFLSYAPHFWVMFYLFTHDNAVFTESAQSLVFELLMRSFFLNPLLEPMIYFLLSSDFRREAWITLKKVFCFVSVCRRK